MGQLSKEEVFALAVQRYSDTVFRAALHNCSCTADAEDVVQDVFEKLLQYKGRFESEEHLKAWLLRVAINCAKNAGSSFWRRKTVPLEDYMDTLEFPTGESRELFAAVMALPEKYRLVIHLHYYEDESVAQIARLLNLTESNVKVRLSRGRGMLR